MFIVTNSWMASFSFVAINPFLTSTKLHSIAPVQEKNENQSLEAIAERSCRDSSFSRGLTRMQWKELSVGYHIFIRKNSSLWQKKKNMENSHITNTITEILVLFFKIELYRWMQIFCINFLMCTLKLIHSGRNQFLVVLFWEQTLNKNALLQLLDQNGAGGN